jgi:hypothetical protein
MVIIVGFSLGFRIIIIDLECICTHTKTFTMFSHVKDIQSHMNGIATWNTQCSWKVESFIKCLNSWKTKRNVHQSSMPKSSHPYSTKYLVTKKIISISRIPLDTKHTQEPKTFPSTFPTQSWIVNLAKLCKHWIHDAKTCVKQIDINKVMYLKNDLIQCLMHATINKCFTSTTQQATYDHNWQLLTQKWNSISTTTIFIDAVITYTTLNQIVALEPMF